MNDYDEQLLEGTPNLTEEALYQLKVDEEALKGYTEPFQLDQNQQATQPQVSQPTATAEGQQAPPEQPQTGPYRTETGDIDLEKMRREGAEFDLMGIAGLTDFAIDALNLIPGVDLPKIPKFENDVAQSSREIMSVVVPTIALGGAGTAALTAKAGQLSTATRAGKLLNDPLVRHIGTAAFSAGAGAAVDYTIEINQEDDNLTGTLRKTYPRYFGWLPENLATLDSDSPEVKRTKNVLEGTYLGLGADMLLGLNKLFRGRGGFAKGAPIPETEKAGEYFSRNIEPEGTVDDVVEASAAARSDSLDEIGNYNLSKRVVETEVPVTGRDYYIETMSARATDMPIDEARRLYTDAWDQMDDVTRKGYDDIAEQSGATTIQRSVDTSEPIFGYHDLYGYQEMGVRSVDNLGIVGAAIDVARISSDTDTIYGRVGNAVSEGALKFSLENVDNQLAVQKGLADVLTAADDYGYRSASGVDLSSADIKDAGERLAASFYEMDLQALRTQLPDLSDVKPTGVEVLSDDAYKGVVDALKKYMDDFANMDYMKAQAYVGTSFGGQISDMAQGMRLTEGTPAIERASEQILDRMEFLMVQKNMASYTKNKSNKMLSLFNKLTTGEALDLKEAKRIERAIRGETNTTEAALNKIKEEARFTIDNLREISQTQPEMLRPLMLAYEMSDGNISTITKMNNYLKQSTGTLSKAFIDLQPEIPSVIMKGFWSNVYNSTLSAFSTPIKAGISNTVQLIEKPLRVMAGGLLNGDLQTVRRGWYQYSSITESLQESFGYMKQVFKRSGMDPNIIEAREDYGIASRQLELINSFADAKAAQGEYGPQFMAEVANNMNDLANHPWLRFGNRAMQAMDGFTQSMVAMSEAKARVFDDLTKGGKIPFDEKVGNELYRKVYDKMFDADGLITDSAVKATTGEIALNLDNAATNSLSNLINYMPVLKPFLLFTKTPINELKLAASYNPLGLFVKDANAFKLPFEEMPYEEVERLLTARGIEVNQNTVMAKYNEIRADMKGRKALGAMAVTGAVSLFLNDSITGNGLYDKQKQALRRNADWKPRSIRLPGGEWVSYDNLGPITSWLSLTVDIMDNMDTLAPNDIGENLHKMMFVLGSSITDKTALAGLEPLMDILGGNAGAVTKWSSSFLTSAVVPGSSQLAEISRLLDPGLKEVEMNVFDLMRNRMPFTKSQLPAKYDWIDGGEVGVPDNIFARVWNTYMPWKVNGKISPEKQFLMDIEYDARPTLATDGNGVKLTAEERSEITNIMGRDGLFRSEIQRIMKTTEAKAFRQRYNEAVANGLSPDLSKYQRVHTQLDIALRRAMRKASAASPNRSAISRRGYIQEIRGRYLQQGDQKSAQEFMEYMNQFSY